MLQGHHGLGLRGTQGLHLPPERRAHLAGFRACQAARCQPVHEMLCCTCCGLQLAMHLQIWGWGTSQILDLRTSGTMPAMHWLVIAHWSMSPIIHHSKPSMAAGWQACNSRGLATCSKQAGAAWQAVSGLTVQHQQCHANLCLAPALQPMALAVVEDMQHLHRLEQQQPGLSPHTLNPKPSTEWWACAARTPLIWQAAPT